MAEVQPDADEAATRAAFSALKPTCLRVMQALQLAQQQRAAPLRAAADALAAQLLGVGLGGGGHGGATASAPLPRRGLPRCVDYVLIPLLMALPEELPPAAALPGGADSALRAIAALIVAAGSAAFFSADASPAAALASASGAAGRGGGGNGGGSRADDVLLRAAVVVSAVVERSRPSLGPSAGGGAASSDEDAEAALDLIWLVCALMGGLGESEAAVEGEARRLVLQARNGNVVGQNNASPELSLPLLLCLRRDSRAAPRLFPLLCSRAFAGHLVALIVEIIVSGEPPTASSAVPPQLGELPDARPHAARFSRATRLAAVRALSGIMTALAHERGGPVAQAASSANDAAQGSGPSLLLLAPFLPGITIGLLKVVAPMASVKGAGGASAPRAGSRVTAACTHALRLLLELSIADDVCRLHCPAALAACGGDAGATGALLLDVAAGRPAVQTSVPDVDVAPPGLQALHPDNEAWWATTCARLNQVLRLLTSHVALHVLEPPPVVGAALLLLCETVLSRCSLTLRTSAPCTVACALLVQARLGPAAAGSTSRALERSAAEFCGGSLSCAALAAVTCQLPLALLSHQERFAEDAVLDGAARVMRDLATAAANVTADARGDDIAAACAIWTALAPRPTEVMRLATLELEAIAGPGVVPAMARSSAAAFLRGVVLIWSCAAGRDVTTAAGPEEAAAECLGELLLRTLRLVPLAQLHLVPAATAGLADPPFLAASDMEALGSHGTSLSSLPVALASMGASAIVRPQDRTLVDAMLGLLRALSVSALGPSGSLALIALLADSRSLAGGVAAGCSEHLLAGLTSAEAEALPALQPHLRAVQALWLGHRLLAACSAELSTSVSRFLSLRAAAPAAAAATAESQVQALLEARGWAACVAGGSRVLVAAAATALGLRAEGGVETGAARAWLGLLHVQAARALASAAASCGRAFECFAASVLPLLLALALESGPAAAGPAGEAIGVALCAIAEAAAVPPSALEEARERLLPLPRPIGTPLPRAFDVRVFHGGAPVSGPGLALQLHGASSASAGSLGPALRPALPGGLSELLAAHASGLADVAISQLRAAADLARLGEDSSEEASQRLAQAPRVAALLVANAAARGSDAALLLPLLQDVSFATADALCALSASPGAGSARGELAVELVCTLDAVIGAAATLGLARAGDAPGCILGDALDDARRPRGVAGRLRAARSTRALRAVRALPFLPVGARDVVVRALLAAGEHLSAAAAAFGPSGVAAAAAVPVLGPQALRVTLAALRAVMSGCEALARHPEALYPVLHVLWPSIVALLPPINFAEAAIAAAQARMQSSLLLGSQAADAGAKLLWPEAEAGTGGALVPAAASLSGELGPAAAVGAPTLLEQTRAFMARRADALGRARSNYGCRAAQAVEIETRRLGLPANAAPELSGALRHGGALVVELDSVTTGGAASEGGAAEAAARNASPSALTLLVHSAALELVAAIAVEPEPVVGARGAFAGDFLRARFAADVWPRLRGVLLACAVRPRRDDGASPSLQRLFVAALACVRRLSRPSATVAMATQEEDSSSRENAPQPLPPTTVVHLAASVLDSGAAPGLAGECAVLVALCEGDDGSSVALAASAALCALRSIGANSVSSRRPEQGERGS